MISAGKRIRAWRAELAEAGLERPAWLRESYADPAGFWEKAASELIGDAPGVARSAVFQWYNLFHELGARHATAELAAHRDYSPGRGFRTESYAALSRRARALASAWRAQGVVPGASVCVVLNVSAAYVACVLAAFHCGATLTLLPPDGPSFVRRALAALAVPPSAPPGRAPAPAALPAPPLPTFVVAGTLARPWLVSDPALVLLTWESTPALDAAVASEPHRYAAADAAVRLFSPLSDAWDSPVLLSAEQLYLCALRDALLVFGLEPGQGVAAPGFCEVQFKPGLLFATLAAGATWVEFSMDELEDGRALFDGSVSTLGVNAALRRLLGRSPSPPPSRVTRWFRNLAEDSAVKAWASFEARMQNAGALGMQYFGNSAAGGSILFSPWASLPSSAALFRSPGLPCELREPNGTGMPALADVGMLQPTPPGENTKGIQQGLPEAALGCLVIVDTEHADLWVTNLGSHRRGVVLPERQIEEVLKAEFPDAVRAAVLVVLPLAGETHGQRVALLVYARPGGTIAASAVRDVLLVELGAERVPDQVEVFELNPKLLDPKKDTLTIDRDACRAEYVSGMSWRKSRCAVFRELARLSAEVEAIRNHRHAVGAALEA